MVYGNKKEFLFKNNKVYINSFPLLKNSKLWTIAIKIFGAEDQYGQKGLKQSFIFYPHFQEKDSRQKNWRRNFRKNDKNRAIKKNKKNAKTSNKAHINKKRFCYM